MPRSSWPGGVIVVALLFTASSAEARRLRVEPWVYDPAHSGAVTSDWRPFSGRGEADPALLLAKLLPTSQDAAAGATVEGVRGLVLGELGFDVYGGGHCGAGAPRFNVTLVDGTIYFFGCAYGTHTRSPTKPGTFTRIRFSDGDAFKQLATDPPWPGFGRARVASIEIVFDEGTDVGSGFTALDDIDVNGELIGRGHDD